MSSWKTTSTPSFVARMSNSLPSPPSSKVARKASSVFSCACSDAPRWQMMSVPLRRSATRWCRRFASAGVSLGIAGSSAANTPPGSRSSTSGGKRAFMGSMSLHGGWLQRHLGQLRPALLLLQFPDHRVRQRDVRLAHRRVGVALHDRLALVAALRDARVDGYLAEERH